MAKAGASAKDNTSQLISSLVEVSKLDTLYRDLYFQRARELMGTVLSHHAYTSAKENGALLDLRERQLRTAVERGDWARTGELTERVRKTRESVAAARDSMGLAEAVYDQLANIPTDPFSPGFHVFLQGTTESLEKWRSRAIAILTTLERTDATKRDFYARRRTDLQELKVGAQTEQKKAAAPVAADLQQEALRALDSGDLSQLDRLVAQLKNKPEAKEEKQESAEVNPVEVAELGEDLLFNFSERTLAAASQLGLTPARTNSRRQFAYLLAYSWQPSFMQTESKRWARDQLTHLMSPTDTAGNIKDAIELYLLNPFMTSGGTRYRVCLVVEDLLLEDFPEPEPKAELPRSGLLSALGLESRRGLSRIDLENALLQHGPRIVSETLELDPEAFRLVAIPPDIYTHLGQERGWGQKEMWTHFDGYWLRDGGKLQVLAGGDKRFGGTHDVVSFSPNYSSETILARFAVVQRKRMMTWQKR
jgi:hypothetical protein